MASIKQLAINPTGNMIVRDAAGTPMEDEKGPWSIDFHSPGTKQFQKAYHAFQEKKSGGLAALMGGNKDKKDPAQDVKDLAAFLADCTVSFNNFDYEGKVGHAAFLKAYEDIEIGHVADDANNFLGKRGNFWTPPATASVDSSDMQLG